MIKTWIVNISYSPAGAPGQSEQAAQYLPSGGLMWSKWSEMIRNDQLPHSAQTAQPAQVEAHIWDCCLIQVILASQPELTHLVLNMTRLQCFTVFSIAREYCFDNHGSDLVFIWKLMSHDWMTALKMLDDAIKIQKDECQKDLTAHLWIRLFIKSDDWGWMLGPGLHWVRMTNVGLTSY